MDHFAIIGWILAGGCALGWWLTLRYDAHEREIVTALQQIAARVAQIEQRMHAEK